MATIPLDTRKRLLACYDAGKRTRAETAELFGVSTGMVKKLLSQRKRLGHIKPLHERTGRKPKLNAEQTGVLREALRATPDLTLEQMRALLGGVCSAVCIHYTLKKAGYSYKKSPSGRRSRTATTCVKAGSSGSRAARRF